MSQYKKSFTHSPGLAIPTGTKQACYDPKKNSYTREACTRKYLIGQGVGSVYGKPDTTRAFSSGFSSAFK